MRDDSEKLQDILEAIAQIERYANKGHEAFERDELLQVWLVHHVQIVGEAVSQLSEVTREQNPDVPWRQITAMRNILVHAYFKIDLDELWGVVERDLPILKARIEAILGE